MDEVGTLIKKRFEVADINRTHMVHFTPSERYRIRNWIDEHPEIVRCMECMYATVAPDDNGYFYCKYPFASEAPHESHFYCANGVRKAGDGDVEN